MREGSSWRGAAWLFVALIAATCSMREVAAQPGSVGDSGAGQQTAIVTLDTGEVLRGRIVARTDGALLLSHPVLGSLAIPQGRVQQTTIVAEGGATDPQASALPATPPSQPTGQAALGADGADSEGVKTPGPQNVKPPLVEAPKPAWAISLEFGLSGSQGNTDQLLARGGVNATRDVPSNKLVFDGSYRRRTTSGDTTENRLFVRARQEWKRSATTLRPFYEGSFEYDEFRAFDWRGRVAGGLAYPIIDEDRTRLTGRLGGGVTRDFGGPNPRSYPEGLAQLEFSHRISERIALSASTLYLPDLEQVQEFRWENRARVDFALDEKKKLLLSLGVEDRFESDPGPSIERNDLDYFVSLVFRF